LGARLDAVQIDDEFEPATLAEQIEDLDIRLLVLDHLGKLAERSPDFGPNSQGDAVLWGRLVAPFTQLARDLDLAVVLLDQSRRSDGRYAGSTAKAGTVDLLCEFQPKDGGLVCTPRGRIALPPFRVDLDAAGCPQFTRSIGEGPETRRAGRGDALSQRDRMAVLGLLQSAEPDGLSSKAWGDLTREAFGLSRRSFFNLRRSLFTEALVSYTSRTYRVTSTGARALERYQQEAA
jgi:hypothetical protein